MRIRKIYYMRQLTKNVFWYFVVIILFIYSLSLICLKINNEEEGVSFIGLLTSRVNSSTSLIISETSAISPTCDLHIAIILCQAGGFVTYNRNVTRKTNKKSSSKPMVAKDFQRQLNQSIVLLKSLALQLELTNCVNLYIFADDISHYDLLRSRMKEEMSWKWRRLFNLTYLPVTYPKDTKKMTSWFRPCATLRLFLPDVMPSHVTTLLYVDTDFIFLNSPRLLMNEFLQEGSNTTTKGKVKMSALAAMAPCLFHYGSEMNAVPFYGRTGLNAGLMAMDLRKMRKIGWTSRMKMVTAMYRATIKLADQDILNIYFHFFPEELHLLSCAWNVRPFQCRTDHTCDDLSNGIYALHGNALSFTKAGPEPLFKVIFEEFQGIRLDDEFEIEKFMGILETKLLKAEERLHSDCIRYGGFSALVLNRIDSQVRKNK